MKWFKHFSNAHKGSVLQELYLHFGVNEGHGIYFRLIEYLTDKWDGSSEPRFRILTSELRQFTKLTSPRFRQLAAVIESSGESEFKISENFCDIYLPKLLEVRHRDALNASTRQALLQHESGGEKNKKKNKEEKRDRESAAEPLHPLAEIWNLNCGELSKVQKSNKARNKKAEIRWPENSPDEWAKIVQRIAASDFCKGKSDRGWKATFDWLLQPETHLKVAEGKYDSHSGAQISGATEEELEIIRRGHEEMGA